MSAGPRHYLLVTHIPFLRNEDGSVTVDGLWARDLEGLAESLGAIRVAAPELRPGEVLPTWGPSAAVLPAEMPVSFAGLPPAGGRADLWRWPAIRRILRREVAAADLVHSSNFFPPYTGLYYAHHYAVARGRRTLLVIAEDFADMLQWEWVREGRGRLERWRRQRTVRSLDARVREAARTASLTFLHTPAAVSRYRLETRHGIAIRQPGHEARDVIAAPDLEARCAATARGDPLVLVAACRHEPLKGLEFLVGAVAHLAAWGVRVEARVFGQGQATPALRALAERLGIAERVSFPGALSPGPAVYQALAQGHVFVMPHRTTDFGRAFFDAMAGGSPVVAFRGAASADTVRDGVDGLLAPADDVEGLAAAIRRFHCDRGLLDRASWAARDRALTNTRSLWFGWRAGWIRELFETEGKR